MDTNRYNWFNVLYISFTWILPFVTLIALFFYKNIQSYINITHGEPEVSILKDLNNIVLKIIQLFVVNISTFNKVKNKKKKDGKIKRNIWGLFGNNSYKKKNVHNNIVEKLLEFPFFIVASQYAQNVVLTSIRRRFNAMDVVWMSKRCRVLTGIWFIF